jgi:hypothetical protein
LLIVVVVDDDDDNDVDVVVVVVVVVVFVLVVVVVVIVIFWAYNLLKEKISMVWVIIHIVQILLHFAFPCCMFVTCLRFTKVVAYQ